MFDIPSPVQVLQFSPTSSVCYTVPSPRTAISTSRFRLMNPIQIKNYSLHLLAPLGGPVAGRHLRIHIQYQFPSLRVPVSSFLSQHPAPLLLQVTSPHPAMALLCTTTKTASKLRHSQFCVVNRRYIESPIYRIVDISNCLCNALGEWG